MGGSGSLSTTSAPTSRRAEPGWLPTERDDLHELDGATTPDDGSAFPAPPTHPIGPEDIYPCPCETCGRGVAHQEAVTLKPIEGAVFHPECLPRRGRCIGIHSGDDPCPACSWLDAIPPFERSGP